jgi:hypothetical protein
VEEEMIWLLGFLGVGGTIVAAVVFAAQFVPFLIPTASLITSIAKGVWRILTATFVWSWKQAAVAPAWTGVMLGLVALVAWQAWDHGYDRGWANRGATQVVIHDKQIVYLQAAKTTSEARTAPHAAENKHNQQEAQNVAQQAAARQGAGDECVPVVLADRLRELH